MSPAMQSKPQPVIRFLFHRLWVHKTWLIYSALCVLVAAGVQVTTSTLVKTFLDEALIPKDWQKVLWFCGALIVLFFVDGFSDYLHRFFIRVAMERTVAKLRQDLYEKILCFSPRKLAEKSSGRAVNLMTSDIQVLGMGTHVTADLLREPVVFLALLGYLFYLNWTLTLVCFVAAPIIGLLGKKLGKKAKGNQARIQNSLEKISSHVIETLGGLKTAQSFSQTPLLKDEFNKKNDWAYKDLVGLARIEEAVGPLTKWMTSWIGAVLIGFGAYLVVNDHLSTGGLVAFITAAGLLQQPLRQLNHVGVRIQQLAAAGERIYDALNEDLDPVEKLEADSLALSSSDKKINTSAAELVFENVHFVYPNRAAAVDEKSFDLHEISFKVSPKERLALVGRSGSGKTTVTQLALRFLIPQSGQVLLNGKDSGQYTLTEYRKYFSYVSQDVFLFHRSIRDNLKLARMGASDDEIFEALKKAHVQDFVFQLPQKLDTVLGEKAQTLSGGERQRIAIARAFLRNAPILILDEATSQLDAHSERAVQEALDELVEGRSVILVAHRLSTVRSATEILVMEKGRILERGSPADLLSREKSAFSQLWKSQNDPHGT